MYSSSPTDSLLCHGKTCRGTICARPCTRNLLLKPVTTAANRGFEERATKNCLTLVVVAAIIITIPNVTKLPPFHTLSYSLVCLYRILNLRY